MERDANAKGNTLASGTSHKSGFHGESPESHGMGTVGGDPTTGPQKPAPNPSKKAPRGHTIK